MGCVYNKQPKVRIGICALMKFEIDLPKTSMPRVKWLFLRVIYQSLFMSDLPITLYEMSTLVP